MATHKKKRADEVRGDSPVDVGERFEDKCVTAARKQSDSSDTNKEEDMDTGEVQVDFEARNPEDCDFHGMRKLLQQDSALLTNCTGPVIRLLFLKANVNLSELTDALIGQNYVGSVIKQVPLSEEEDEDDDDDDSDDVFGLVSVLNITSENKQKATAANDIKKYLLDKCSDCAKEQKEQMSGLLSGSDRQVGLLINERFMNIPPQIALPAFQSLWKEIERARKKGMKYDFSHYVLVCKMLRMAPLELPGRKQKPTARHQWDIVYVNPEEEIFAEEAEIQFDFCVREERDLDSECDDMEPWRRVLVLSAPKIDSVMVKLARDLAQG